MPPVGKVGKAPDGYFVSHQGDPGLQWYVFIADDRGGETGGFFIYWNQSPAFDAEPLFDNWAENEDALDGWSWEGFEWAATATTPTGLSRP